MEFDMPYSKFREMARLGLVALSSSERTMGCTDEAGIIATQGGVLFYSVNSVKGRRARASVKADNDTQIESVGAIGLRDSARRVFCRDTLRLEPHDESAQPAYRIRCRTEGVGSDTRLSWCVYLGLSPTDPKIIQGSVQCSALADVFMRPPEWTEITIRQASLRRAIDEMGASSGKGDSLYVGKTNSLPFMILERSTHATRIELAPEEFNYAHRHGGLSLAYGDFLDVVRANQKYDVMISRATSVFGGNMARFQFPEGFLDVPGNWFWELLLLKRFHVPRSVRPLIVNRRELLQAVSVVRAWGSKKVQIRHHPHRPLLTLIRGSRVRKGKLVGGVAAADCLMPSGSKDVRTWCVDADGLQEVIARNECDRIRIYPVSKALIIDDPEEPLVRHRLACNPPDDLGRDVEKELLAIEASMVESAGII